MDVLDDILGSLRMNGGVVFDAVTTGGWRLISQFTPEDCGPWFPTPQAIISYHYVRTGVMFVRIPGQDPVEVPEGAMVLFPRNDVHEFYTDAEAPAVDLGRFVRPSKRGGTNLVKLNFGGSAAACYCGWLGVVGGGHPLLNALPSILLAKREDQPADWIAASLKMAISDWSSSPAMVAQVSKLIFAHAVRRYARELGKEKHGWVAGLMDPALARVLAVIHGRYAENLDIDQLAREAGLSRTVLGERFNQVLGEPPMKYCARWRMRVAANRLLDGDGGSAGVAYDVGFNSAAAFSRAFKREFGEPPAAWKRRTEAEAELTRQAYADVQ